VAAAIFIIITATTTIFNWGLIRDIGTSFQKGVELKIYIYIVKYKSIVEPNLKPVDPEGDTIMAR
jgi:hypothetical protein